MKQQEDQKTIEISFPTKRGRPATGKARTAAQRKSDQRARDLTKAWEEKDLINVTDTGLISMLSQATKPGWDAKGNMAKEIWLEFGKRRGFIA